MPAGRSLGPWLARLTLINAALGAQLSISSHGAPQHIAMPFDL
jgi:hypothetical protein